MPRFLIEIEGDLDEDELAQTIYSLGAGGVRVLRVSQVVWAEARQASLREPPPPASGAAAQHAPIPERDRRSAHRRTGPLRQPWPRPGIRRLLSVYDLTDREDVDVLPEPVDEMERRILDYGAAGGKLMSGHLRHNREFERLSTNQILRILRRLVESGHLVQTHHDSYRRPDRLRLDDRLMAPWDNLRYTTNSRRPIPTLDEVLQAMISPLDDVTIAAFMRVSCAEVRMQIAPYIERGEIAEILVDGVRPFYAGTGYQDRNLARVLSPLGEDEITALNALPRGLVSAQAVDEHLADLGPARLEVALEGLHERGLIRRIPGIVLFPLGTDYRGKGDALLEITEVGLRSKERISARRVMSLGEISGKIGLPILLDSLAMAKGMLRNSSSSISLAARSYDMVRADFWEGDMRRFARMGLLSIDGQNMKIANDEFEAFEAARMIREQARGVFDASWPSITPMGVADSVWWVSMRKYLW